MAQLSDLTLLFSRLGNWVGGGSRSMMDKAVTGLAGKYRQQIKQGKNADGSNMAPLTKATIEGPIRREGNNAIRSRYGNSPLDATGETINSIQGVKAGFDTWEIAPQTDKGRKIINSNAKTHHGGFRFYGDTPKPVRDPLTISEPQMDYMEDQIFKDLERVLNSL